MKISNILRKWYEKSARDLPWRETINPYRIWISEIILQQTQVIQGIDYYLQFIKQFPDVESLASANEEEVLRLWQGLGYYSRARNLHSAAKQVINEYNGILPDNFIKLKTLKGVGDYTAAAIASIAFNEPVAAVDGNVSRVISRICGIDVPVNSSNGKKMIQEVALDILDKKDPGTSNQALMEFGALHCKPVNPKCSICPLNNICKSYHDGTTHKIPVKVTRKEIRKRWFNYFIITYNDSVFIQQRKKEDIWKSLFQFPLLETSEDLPADRILKKFLNGENYEFGDFTIKTISDPILHQLTHQQIITRFVELLLNKNAFTVPDDWIEIKWHQMDNFPVPRLIERYLEEKRKL